MEEELPEFEVTKYEWKKAGFGWAKVREPRPENTSLSFDFYFQEWKYKRKTVEIKLLFEVRYCSKSFLEDGVIGALVEMNIKDVDDILRNNPCSEGSIGYLAQFYRAMCTLRGNEMVAEISKILGIQLAPIEPPTTEFAKQMVLLRLSMFLRQRGLIP